MIAILEVIQKSEQSLWQEKNTLLLIFDVLFFYCNTQLLADVHIKNVLPIDKTAMCHTCLHAIASQIIIFFGGKEDMHSLL